jgi:hypothetical protein
LNRQFGKRQIPAGNPLANALVVIVGALAIGASLILGVVALLVLGSIVMVLAAIIGIRVWWLNRRLAGQYKSARDKTAAQQVDIIEGEYRIITPDRKPDSQSGE